MKVRATSTRKDKRKKRTIMHQSVNGKWMVSHVGFYWAMRNTKGIRPKYYTPVICSVCGRYDAEGFLYPMERGDYVGLCCTCKWSMKNSPIARIIYTPMGNKR